MSLPLDFSELLKALNITKPSDQVPMNAAQLRNYLSQFQDKINALQVENEKLRAKLARTKEHFRKWREENKQVEQSVFESLYDEIEKLKNEKK